MFKLATCITIYYFVGPGSGLLTMTVDDSVEKQELTAKLSQEQGSSGADTGIATLDDLDSKESHIDSSLASGNKQK